ncbi:TIGR03086 family metal-binding protein [Nonomuraea candida]|uniref:TIGR03086 family metal-binding protein n=1 Tax=Nonomuraea candida TaxID=359159 RepID=UPI0005BA0C3F|nr:TIGR03086 family metal-binding protein [Nonomuraea candida]
MPAIDLGSAAREVVRLLDGVTEDRLNDPTPCDGTSVAALLDHLMGLSLAFTWAARKITPPEGATGPSARAERLDPQWRTLLPQRLDELVESWRDPKAWEGTAEAGGVTMPADQLGVVALDELVLHGWDLARATGQPFTCTPEDTEAVLAFTRESAQPGQEAGREGLFGPVVEVPEDAPPFDRALGFAGRNPAWTPDPT